MISNTLFPTTQYRTTPHNSEDYSMFSDWNIVSVIYLVRNRTLLFCYKNHCIEVTLLIRDSPWASTVFLSSPVSYLKHRQARGRRVSENSFPALLASGPSCMTSPLLPSSTMDPHHRHYCIHLNYDYCLSLSSPSPILHIKLRPDPKWPPSE